MTDGATFEIDTTIYTWCVRVFSLIHERLGIHVKEHDADGKIAVGQIFLFNHFTRFETIIPQYIIHRATGDFCRCVAAGELFRINERFTKLLWGVGAVPSDHPGLLAFLAAEILRGRKVIFFPEGGMIKDRRVVDDEGEFNIRSPLSKKIRKHHKGAAATALTLEIFKKRILSVSEAGETARLQRWVDALGVADIDALIAAARKPTLVVPSNITFYPIHTDDNILRKGAELFGLEMSTQVNEELLIEGNLILKQTDMDVRFGAPIDAKVKWSFWERMILKRIFERIHSLPDLFGMKDDSDRLIDRMLATALNRETRRLRDTYVREIYACTTVNLSHLASRLIMVLVQNGTVEIDRERYHRLLYIALKNVQQEPDVYLHRSITNPEAYEGIHRNTCRGFEQFLNMAVSSGLIAVGDKTYRLLPRLREEHSFHEIRLKNVIAVYANEMAPVPGACRAVDRALATEAAINGPALARMLFDDEVRAFSWCKINYGQARHRSINAQETATEDGEPFHFIPGNSRDIGIVLIHGLLASPAETRAFGERLASLGFPVVGVRLKGHGTSPWDLRDRTWQDWLGSARGGYEIMSGLADKLCLIGFSTGASLALHLAAERPADLQGVVAISPTLRFRNRNLAFVPLLHGINKLAEWIPTLEGVKPFRLNESEHPHINYRNIPIRCLFELRRLVQSLMRRLPDVTCPALIIQGDGDKIVDPKSSEIVHDRIGSIEKTFHMVSSVRHGILHEDIDGTQARIIDFIVGLNECTNTGEETR